MWSGNDRDDYITPGSNINTYPFQFKYVDNVMSAISGGASIDNHGNTKISDKDFFAMKNRECKAIENYLHLTTTWHYLSHKGFPFIFLNFLDSQYSSRTAHFDIKNYLPDFAKNGVDKMITNIIDPYSFALKQDQLWEDDFHPSPHGHLTWTKNILLPKLQELFG